MNEIRRLQSGDWKIWKEIRLEALQLHPEAFGGAYEEERLENNDYFKQELVRSDLFGTFVDSRLVGMAGFFSHQGQKKRHRGTLFSMYLRAENRSQGIVGALVKKIIDHAKTKVLQLHCAVVTENSAALKLYQRHGFQIYGTEPRTLSVNGRYYDEHLMVLMFNS